MRVKMLSLCRISYLLLALVSSSANGNNSETSSLESLASQFREIMKENLPTFVVATATSFFSFDPLDGDFARNIDTMRLLYATPLEMDAEGKYTSTVLDKFHFESKSNKIVFKIKDNVHYDDGSTISIDDIGLSIKRMMLTHPDFPTIKEIKGIESWRKLNYPLNSYPEGLKIDRDRGILEIYLKTYVEAPLFRFSLELFSIIPSVCIDLNTNKLKCDVPAFSGRYRLSDNVISKSNKKAEFPVFIKFQSRGPGVPKNMWIAFISPVRIIEYADDFNDVTIIKANEIDIPNIQKGTLSKKLAIYSSPKILYSVISLNPASKTFKDKRVRQYFAMKFRNAVKEYGFEPEGSIFTSLLIGYIPLTELMKMIPPFSKEEESRILNHLKAYPPVFLKEKATKLHPFTYILSATLKSMGLPDVQPLETGDFKSLWEKGDLAIRPATCGFWPIDPTGDIRMVFTAGLHAFVINDTKVSKLIEKLKYRDKKSHVELNRHIFEDSKMAITTNYSRLYFMSKKASLFLPYGISGPQPWFFFREIK